ncbi:DUF6265 family protein [Mesonia sp. K7]|uniref:DUF6265 family protein n=1 Tax=Mesonia sp. K7 TaxID=2218606 RepID=UPI001F2273E2|nr:DUF6265 family protein [Mesonia sp. K7]
MKLLQEDDQLFYIPTVKNQNDEKPVKFVMKTITDLSVKFENPKHDFPQVIQYKRIKTDSMVAEILGIKNGLERNISFPMKRRE